MIRLVLVVALIALAAARAPQAGVRNPGFMWATVTVEREVFMEDPKIRGEYATSGKFDGVAMMYISPERKVIRIQGLKAISMFHLGQEKDDKVEMYQESFTLQSIIKLGDGEYAFEATSDGTLGRTVTGKLRYDVVGTGLALQGSFTEVRLDEQGQMFKGVMNRYSMARSAPALAMLKQFGEVFLGGNYVALEAIKR